MPEILEERFEWAKSGLMLATAKTQALIVFEIAIIIYLKAQPSPNYLDFLKKNLAGFLDPVDLFNPGQQSREILSPAGLHSLFPFGEQFVRLKFPVKAEDPAEAAPSPPLEDHNQGQGVEGHVRAGKKTAQRGEGEEQRLSDHEQKMRRPLFMEEKPEFSPDMDLVQEPGMDDAQRAGCFFDSFGKRLFLAEDPLGQEHELFLGYFQGSPGPIHAH
jgi:hypothetical protein